MVEVSLGGGTSQRKPTLLDELGKVYEQYRQGLYTLALAITRSPAEAEDAVQEAFARLWGSRARPADGSLVAYVFAAVRNAALDQVRRRGRLASHERSDPFDDRMAAVSIFNGTPEDPAAKAIDAERHRLIRQAVDELPEAEREAVVMKVYGGLTFEEIARIRGEPLPTVASRYRRALEKLGRMVKGVAESSHE
jgi:RNA polymerase sigma-70 factor (ECF subfamily)